MKNDKIGASQIKHGIIDFCGGTVGGISTVLVGQPLDTVKVKMQTFPKLYSGMFDCFMKTYTIEGLFRGLYAGTLPAIAANVAENSVLFACYGMCQKLVARALNVPTVDELNFISNATAGSLASFFSAFTLCPTELIKIKLQCAREVTSSLSNEKKKVTAFKLIQGIVHTEGVIGLFRGLQPTIIREMPGYFVFFGAYEGTREFFAPVGGSKNECGPLITILAGGLAGIALWLVIYPIDVVKSRVQIFQGDMNHSLLKHTTNIIKQEGALILYNGLQPTLIRTIPASAALFLSYEWTKQFLYNHI